MNEPSIFTKIARGEIPCHKIYEDEMTLAFLELKPIKRGHVLVIPKEEVNHIWDMPDEDYTYLWSVAKRVAKRIKEVYQPARVGVIVEGFGVPHAHIHLIPIDQAHDLRQEGQPMNEEELVKVAEELRMI